MEWSPAKSVVTGKVIDVAIFPNSVSVLTDKIIPLTVWLTTKAPVEGWR